MNNLILECKLRDVVANQANQSDVNNINVVKPDDTRRTTEMCTFRNTFAIYGKFHVLAINKLKFCRKLNISIAANIAKRYSLTVTATREV